jgi:hypothetical protein
MVSTNPVNMFYFLMVEQLAIQSAAKKNIGRGTDHIPDVRLPNTLNVTALLQRVNCF